MCLTGQEGVRERWAMTCHFVVCFGSFHSPPFTGNVTPELPGKTTSELCLGGGGSDLLSKCIINQAFMRAISRLSG